MSAEWMTRIMLVGAAAAALSMIVGNSPAESADGPAQRPAIGRVLSADTSASAASKRLKSPMKGGKANPKGAHVGISLGDGKSVENKKLPKSKTLCAPPGGGKPRAC